MIHIKANEDIFIDGCTSSNDLDVANDAIDRVVDLLEGDRQWTVRKF